MSDREILEELLEEKRRQDRIRYVKYAVWGVIAIAVIILCAVYVPKIVALYNEVNSTMEQVDQTMQQIDSSLQSLKSDYDAVKSAGQGALEEAAEAVNALIEQIRSFGIFR